jgi:ribosome-binding protein aMBF1 (putative translation factor)
MSAPHELLGVALMRVDLAMDALASAKKALLAAAALTAVDRARQAIDEEGWPQGAVEFGQAVRAAREAARLSRLKLAERIHISEATLRNVESGRRVRSTIRALLIKSLVKAPS